MVVKCKECNWCNRPSLKSGRQAGTDLYIRSRLALFLPGPVGFAGVETRGVGESGCFNTDN